MPDLGTFDLLQYENDRSDIIGYPVIRSWELCVGIYAFTCPHCGAPPWHYCRPPKRESWVRAHHHRRYVRWVKSGEIGYYRAGRKVPQ